MFITAKWVGQKERISEFEGKTVEITQNRKIEIISIGAIYFKKCTEPQENYETITEDVMSVLLKFQKKK